MLSRLLPTLTDSRVPRIASGIPRGEGIGLMLRASAVALATLLALAALGLGRVGP